MSVLRGPPRPDSELNIALLDPDSTHSYVQPLQLMSLPIVLYAHATVAPNPWKVAIVLEELEIEYLVEFVGDVKKLPYIEKNPNGR